MPDDVNILISVENRYVQSMLDGTKTVELRRRAIRVPKGSCVWIYSKVPEAKVRAYGIVDRIIESSPCEIWEEYGAVSGITEIEFFSYFNETKRACAILFQSVTPLKETIALSELRQVVGSFHPPQFFKFLKEGSPELTLFKERQLAAYYTLSDF